MHSHDLTKPDGRQLTLYSPLAVTVDPAHPTEMPAGDDEIAVFENRFPALAPDAHDPPDSTVPTAPAEGLCEVVVFTQDPQAALGRMPLARITEIGAGMFAMDVLPETTAYELQQVDIDLEDGV
jgi:galactose-1-phosphate uridylyltransferase